MITHVVMMTLRNQISPHHHISVGRSEILRNLPVLDRHSAAESSDNHWEFICHSDGFSSGVYSANYAIQYVVIVRFPTFWKLNDTRLSHSIARAMTFQGKVQQQQETTKVVVQTSKKTAITKTNWKGQSWTGAQYSIYVDTTRLRVNACKICDI